MEYSELVSAVLEENRQVLTAVDPKTVDLMWELHADLGSKAPIHIICGYRSATTNAMLKKIGRNVARQGKASQKNTAHGGDPARGIDGNTNGTYGDGGQTHTAENTPDHCVTAPACWLIAERVSEPEPGKHWK